MAIVYGSNLHDEKTSLALRRIEPLYHACGICITLLPMLHHISILEKLKAHSMLWYFTLGGIMTSHALQATSNATSSNRNRSLLPPLIINFLGTSLEIFLLTLWMFVGTSCKTMCGKYLPLTLGDFQLFKHFEWWCGLCWVNTLVDIFLFLFCRVKNNHLPTWLFNRDISITKPTLVFLIYIRMYYHYGREIADVYGGEGETYRGKKTNVNCCLHISVHEGSHEGSHSQTKEIKHW